MSKFFLVFILWLLPFFALHAQEDDLIGDIINDEEEILLDQLGGEKGSNGVDKIPETPRTKKIGDGVSPSELPDFLPQENFERRARESAPKVEEAEAPSAQPQVRDRRTKPVDLNEFDSIDLDADINDKATTETPPVFIPPPTLIGEDGAPLQQNAPKPEVVDSPQTPNPIESIGENNGEDNIFNDAYPPTVDESSEPVEDSVIDVDDPDKELYKVESPPREAPYVDEEDENDLYLSVQEAEEIGNTPSFTKLPFEESREERLKRLEADDYYKDLVVVSSKGAHQYIVKRSEKTGAASIRVGPFPPPALSNGFTFEDIYGTANNPMIIFEYELSLFGKNSDLAAKGSVGFFTATGNGQFASDSVNSGRTAREEYTLYAAPLSAGLIYRLKFWDKQLLIPYVEGGGDYFALLETRDDGQTPGYGGAPAFHGSAGLAIDMESIDAAGIRAIDARFGVNAILLNIEARQYIGLNADLDFTGLLISGGVTAMF